MELGLNDKLDKVCAEEEKEQARECAKAMIEEAKEQGLNARQTMLKQKGAFGSGQNPTFPIEEEIKRYMEEHDIEGPLEAYGDGSFANPNVWWATLGGVGVWFPEWPATPGHGYAMHVGA